VVCRLYNNWCNVYNKISSPIQNTHTCLSSSQLERQSRCQSGRVDSSNRQILEELQLVDWLVVVLGWFVMMWLAAKERFVVVGFIGVCLRLPESLRMKMQFQMWFLSLMTM